MLSTQDSIHGTAYSLQFWGSLIRKWETSGRKEERSRAEIQSRQVRSFLWAACMSTAGVSHSLQRPANRTTRSCSVPILPKWSTRPFRGTIATFKLPSVLVVTMICVFTILCYWQKIFLHLSGGKEFQRCCFLWDINTWLKYIMRLVLFTVKGKDRTIAKANVKAHEICCLYEFTSREMKYTNQMELNWYNLIRWMCWTSQMY